MAKMMDELKIFENSEFGQIRIIAINGEPWFCGKDVAASLGYVDTKKALIQHCKDPWVAIYTLGVQTGTKADGSPAVQQVKMKFIGESNLYRLITHSKLPSAEKFERWIFEEVLPALRKTGRYAVSGEEPEYKPTRPLTSDDYMDAGKAVARCDNRRLPIVLDLFRKAGLDIQKIHEIQKQEAERDPEEDDNGYFIKLLNQHGLNELVEKLGICRTSIYYYRIGKYKPNKERKKLIIRILTEDGEV